MMHHKNVTEEWTQEELPPFDEMILSWNGERPSSGKYLFYVRVKTTEWSPFLLYATWGSDGQQSFSIRLEDAPVRVYQDAIEILEGKNATGFQIQVVPEGTASLEQLHSLHVYTNSDKTLKSEQKIGYSSSIYLPVPGISQMTLCHERRRDLCSPTSTAAVAHYLGNTAALNPIEFAQKSWDGGFDIFGNWVFNVAQASAELGSAWQCWVERLNGFDEIYQKLHEGTPVIVSVRGPLPGGALPYAKGHLMAVIGYDPRGRKVLCMDPAFASDQETHTLYDLSDFVEAWERRGKVAYVFCKH